MEFQQVVDLPGAPAFAPPVKQLPIVGETIAEKMELLGCHLFSDAATDAGG